jgi:nucleotide-binding universal stress UspA family protein
MKLLVATDGSKSALRAVKRAIEFVEDSTAKANSITLVSVHDDAGIRHAKAFVGKSAVSDYLRELSDQDLKSAMKALDNSGIKHDIAILTGNVPREIMTFADKGKYDMIVLGSKGRGAVADFLIGSVAQRVLTHASQAVLLVK